MIERELEKEEKKHTTPRELLIVPPPFFATTSTSSSRCIWCPRYFRCIRILLAATTSFYSIYWYIRSDRYKADDSILETITFVLYEDSEKTSNQKLTSKKEWLKPPSIRRKGPATPEPPDYSSLTSPRLCEQLAYGCFAITYEPLAENSLLAKIGDMTTFMTGTVTDAKKVTKNHATAKPNFKEGDHVRIDVNRPLPLGRPPVHKFYIDRHDSSSCRKDVRTHMRILSVVRIKAYSRYGYDYLSELVLRRADFQEHTIAEKDFKNLYPSDFEDLNLLLLQGSMPRSNSWYNKWKLSTAVQTKDSKELVIRQQGQKYFQLGIESNHTQIKPHKTRMDAKATSSSKELTKSLISPRAVVFPWSTTMNERSCGSMKYTSSVMGC
ncbi:hypothetical protein Tco_1090874 [Tanacetum coccineum]|uniref:Uncharacterized protein n=1 Tax=Tanacetum coccineum TaxID=301880 RepID=A0ABQ5I5G5_9ASTR